MFNVVLFVDSNKTRKSKVKLKRPIRFMNKTSLKTPKGQSENVNQRSDNTMEGQTIQWKDRQFNGRTDNTMAKINKKTKGKTMIYKTFNRKLKIEQKPKTSIINLTCFVLEFSIHSSHDMPEILLTVCVKHQPINLF